MGRAPPGAALAAMRAALAPTLPTGAQASGSMTPMRILQLIAAIGLAAALAPAASAQFSVSGPGASIPFSGTGGGGTWDTIQPPGGAVATSTVTVTTPVANIDSVQINDLNHSWIGDLQVTLADPNGVEHNVFVRPGYGNTSFAGNSGDFLGGDYVFVESGGLDLPNDTTAAVDPPAGTYNQDFDTGGFLWTSGNSNIFNTPMSTISGPAGTWTLKVYDWAGGDTGSFGSWKLNGNGGGGGNTGSGYCFGDGTGTICPCGGFGGAGEGCLTTSGTGAQLTGVGNAEVAFDTLTLNVSGGPANKPGIFFQGNNPLNGGLGNQAGDGLLCTAGGTIRYDVNSLDASGSTSQTGFGVNASTGLTRGYQYWFRDTGNSCGGLFNFTNGWVVTWL